MSFNVNNRTPPAAAARTTAAAETPNPVGEGVKSAKDLLAGGSLNLGVNKDSTKEQVAVALKQLAGDKGVQYANTIEGLGKAFKGRALEGVQKEMGEWLKANPNATPDQVHAQSTKTLYKHTMINQQFKQTIEQMASAAISRMKDTFEG
ncbi:hypothetical protein NR798_34045 [Archangium gephyra]|uniref:hypothetical protein n=1 Tax=Archangium gephyra TaxID=48 RepID=UPI0035D3F339